MIYPDHHFDCTPLLQETCQPTASSDARRCRRTFESLSRQACAEQHIDRATDPPLGERAGAPTSNPDSSPAVDPVDDLRRGPRAGAHHAGNELVVSLGLPPGGARAARVQLAYDAKVLAAVDAPSPDAGRLTVDLDGVDVPLARVRSG